MQNSIVMFTFSVCERKYPFWVNLVQKIKFASLSRNVKSKVVKVLGKIEMPSEKDFSFTLIKSKIVDLWKVAFLILVLNLGF